MAILLLTSLLITIGFNWLIFIFAFKKQSDHFTDITYCLSFLLLASWGLLRIVDKSTFVILLWIMVALWSIRLGLYLLSRITRIGVDHRFDDIRSNSKRYFRFWTIQGISVWIVALPYIIGFLRGSLQSLEIIPNISILGLVFWIIGFLLESIGDFQKYSFRNDPKNEGKFISTGLFKYIRNPNYLGEILCWVGIFVYVSPVLQGWDWMAIISPIWITILLVFISGVPMLEKQMNLRYGQQPEYQAYQKRTYRLIYGIY